MIAPSTSSTNDVNTAKPAYENPNGSNLLQHGLEKIHEDDLEAMDLKWQLSLLSMRAKRECRAPRNKEGQFKYQDNTRKQGNNEDTSSKAMLALDGVGFDWSDMAEEQVQTNMALMAFLDSEVYNDKTCSKTCLKNYETLKKQCDDLIVKLNQTKFTAATYKRVLETVEEQLITYRKNEVLFSEEVAVLKREVACKYYEIDVLKSEFEKVKQEKVGIEFKIEKFNKASKDLDKLLGSSLMHKKYCLVVTDDYSRNSKKDLNAQAVNTARPQVVNTARPNLVKTARPNSAVVNAMRVGDNHEKCCKGLSMVGFGDLPNLIGASITLKKHNYIDGKPQQDDIGFVDSGCSRHMTGNIAYL
ncbi:hypothetical protein Tco_0961975 [Tanacetum coccineum]